MNMPQDKFYITHRDGTQITGSVLKSTKVERSKIGNNKELNLLFDFYSKTGSGAKGNIIDGKAMSKLYSDFAAMAGNDDILSSVEIAKFLKDNKLEGKVSRESVKKFLTVINDSCTVNALYDALNGAGTKNNLKELLQNIPANNINNILTQFKKEYGIGLVQLIANEYGCFGSTRENYLGIIRDKIAQTKDKVEANMFKSEFNLIMKKMDMTIFNGADASELENLVDGKIQLGYPKPQKRTPAEIQAHNKKAVSQMVSSWRYSFAFRDRDKIVDKIMTYADLNSPKKMVAEYAKSSDPRVREAAQNLLDSSFLDYYPIFVAAVISKESQFSETADRVFKNNGKGVMQLTASVADDIAKNPDNYDKDFIARLSKHCDITNPKSIVEAYTAKTETGILLNYDVGMATLTNKMRTYFNQINDNNKNSRFYKTYMNMDVDLVNPATIMEFVAMNYNANSAAKKDPRQDNALSQVNYVFGRDVIERFRLFTPPDVIVRNYFQHNAHTKDFDTITK